MMLRRVAVMISVGLADSINPSTVGPALYLTTAHRRVVRVMQFTIGVFLVELAAGIVLTIGPGRLLLGMVPHPRDTVTHVIELVAGLVLPAVSGLSGSDVEAWPAANFRCAAAVAARR